MLKHRERERDRDREAAARDRPADERPLRERPADDRRERRRDEARHSVGNGSDGGSRMPGSKAVARARAHLAELTGRRSEGVSSLTRTRDGWRVVLEIVELERIPRTTDILASYAIDLDGRGELMGYQRVARYYRSDVDGER